MMGKIEAWQSTHVRSLGARSSLGVLRNEPSGTYLNSDDPRQGLACVGTPLDGNAQGGCTLLDANQGGRGLQQSRLPSVRKDISEAQPAVQAGP